MQIEYWIEEALAVTSDWKEGTTLFVSSKHLFCSSKFGSFDDTRSWKEVKEIEQVHSDKAEEEGKEQSVDACGGADDDIHDALKGFLVKFCRIEIVFDQKRFHISQSLINHAIQSYQFRTSLYVAGPAAGKQIIKVMTICIYWFTIATNEQNVVLKHENIWGQLHCLSATPCKVVYQVKKVECDQKKGEEKE